jgi:hypothetical protein
MANPGPSGEGIIGDMNKRRRFIELETMDNQKYYF